MNNESNASINRTTTHWVGCHDAGVKHYECTLAQIESLTRDLAACFKMAGSDSDGDEDWRIASRAVEAVTQLRNDYKDACNEAHDLRAELDAAKLQVRELRIKYCESEVEREDTARAHSESAGLTPGTAAEETR